MSSLNFLPPYNLGLGASGVVFGLFIIAIGTRLRYFFSLFFLAFFFPFPSSRRSVIGMRLIFFFIAASETFRGARPLRRLFSASTFGRSSRWKWR